VAILVACDCGKTFGALDEAIGLTARCPACGRVQVVPKPVYLAGEDIVVIGPGEPRMSRLAIESVLLGLGSFFCWFFLGVPAIFRGVRAVREITSGGGLIKGEGLAFLGIVLGTIGSVVPLALVPLLPSEGNEAARRYQCVNNLKTIGLAMHNYHAAEGRLPPIAITNPDGKPLLSWRVAILPYLEEKELYDQFHLDEPYDSPHNAALLSRRPQVYDCPTFKAEDRTTTTYQVLIGPGTAFENPKGTTFAEITDGAQNTLLVVESKVPVPWTKPEDLPYNPLGSLLSIGSKHPGGFNTLLADGSVRFLKLTVPEHVLRALITRDGGEPIRPEDY
jgi:prepilin-type processing-associated H-X9-DG protein